MPAMLVICVQKRSSYAEKDGVRIISKVVLPKCHSGYCNSMRSSLIELQWSLLTSQSS